MALTNYGELKDCIVDFMDRTDVSAPVASIVRLAEAKLNREITLGETDQSISSVVDSRSISISSYSMAEAIALWLVESTGTETKMTYKADGVFPYSQTSGKPTIWTVDGNNIDFDRPCDAVYTFRFRYRARFGLADGADSATNELLDNHPDVYLAACIVWGGFWTRDSGAVQGYASLLESELPDVKSEYAQRNRSILTPGDGDLARITRPYHIQIYDGS